MKYPSGDAKAPNKGLKKKQREGDREAEPRGERGGSGERGEIGRERETGRQAEEKGEGKGEGRKGRDGREYWRRGVGGGGKGKKRAGA